MAFDIAFRPSTKAGVAAPNLPALLVAFILFLQTYLALANPAAPAAAVAFAPSESRKSEHEDYINMDRDYFRKNRGKDGDEYNHHRHIMVPRQQQQQQSPGSTCDGPEGQWNCHITSWQRCAVGRWSGVSDVADGTLCHHAGLTYDFVAENWLQRGQATSSATDPDRGARVGGRRIDWPALSIGFVGLAVAGIA